MVILVLPYRFKENVKISTCINNLKSIYISVYSKLYMATNMVVVSPNLPIKPQITPWLCKHYHTILKLIFHRLASCLRLQKA